MSLVYWWPLRTDTRQCGSNETTATCTNCTFTNQSMTNGTIVAPIPAKTFGWTDGHVWTITCKIKMNVLTKYCDIFTVNANASDPTEDPHSFYLRFNTNGSYTLWYCKGNYGWSWISSVSGIDTKWHSIAIRAYIGYSGTTKLNYTEFWLDGVKAKSSASTTANNDFPLFNGDPTLTITASSNVSIKDFKIYNDVISETELYEDLFSPDLCLSIGPNRDISGNDVKVTYSGSRYNSTEVRPKYGNIPPACDDTEQYIKARYYDQQMPYVCYLNGSAGCTELSVMAKIKITGAKSTNYNRIFSISLYEMWFGVNMESASLWLYSNGSYWRVMSLDALDTVGSFHTVGFTFDNGTVEFWVDGVKYTAAKAGSTITTIQSTFSSVNIDAAANFTSWTTANNISTSLVKVALHKVPDKYWSTFGCDETISVISEYPGKSAISTKVPSTILANAFRNNYGYGAGTMYNSTALGPLTIANVFGECVHLEDGSVWFPILYQKCDSSTSNNVFGSSTYSVKKNDLYVNENAWCRSQIIRGIGDLVAIAQDRTYEFMLIQQSESQIPEIFRWTQDANPTSDTTTYNSVGDGKFTSYTGNVTSGIWGAAGIGCFCMTRDSSVANGIGIGSYGTSTTKFPIVGQNSTSFYQILLFRINPAHILGSVFGITGKNSMFFQKYTEIQ